MKVVTPKSYGEWLEWRMGGIGASEAPAVMGSSPWLKPAELWALKTERMIPKPSQPWMRRGKALEPAARQAYERMVGVRVAEAFVQHDRYDFVRASLDGVNPKAKRVVEIKCPGKADHLTAKRGRIPDKYRWQLAHILLVTGYESIDYFSFDGKEGVLIEFRRDPKLEQQLLEAIRNFWVKNVLGDTEPGDSNRFVDGAKIFRIRRSR